MKTLSLVALSALAAALPAQNTNPVYRANRTFYTSMWTANPPEYTTAGQTVAAGTMHWRAFREASNQRGEPRRVTGLGMWWQPSDQTGTFPQTISTLEFRFYPTTTDANGLVVPDVAQLPLLTIPPVPMTVNTGNAFNSLTISLGSINPVVVTGDFALCGVYPANASSTTPGYFGLLPSAANQTYGLQQSFYGFTYPNGTITHFALGGARSSLWYTEDQAVLSVRSNWGISDAHNLAGYIGGSWGDSSYFSPLADTAWAGWSDSRNPATISLYVHAAGLDGTFPIILLNFGPRFPASFQFMGQTLETLPADPLFTALATMGQPIQSGRFELAFPLASAANPLLAGTFLGFEVVLVDLTTLSLADSTQAIWIQN